MKIFEFESDPTSTIISVAEVIRTRAANNNAPAKMDIGNFLQMVNNAGHASLDYSGLKAYFDAEPKLANVIQAFNDQEIVFYDAISAGKEYAKSDEIIVRIAKELHDSMKTSVSVDWLNQESIKATIRKKIKRILIKNDFPVESFEKLVPMIFQQVEANYSEMDF